MFETSKQTLICVITFVHDCIVKHMRCHTWHQLTACVLMLQNVPAIATAVLKST